MTAVTEDVRGGRLVIGIGNADRGDDAAGLLVARRIRVTSPPGVEVIAWEGEPSGLLDLWTPADDVILVDACAAGPAPGAVHRFDGGPDSLPASSATTGAHDLGLAAVLRLAQALGRSPRSLVVYGLEGAVFAVGAGISAEVEGAVVTAASLIVDELTATTPARRPRAHLH